MLQGFYFSKLFCQHYFLHISFFSHSSLLEFGRGACNQAVAPGTTRPPHSPDMKHSNF